MNTWVIKQSTGALGGEGVPGRPSAGHVQVIRVLQHEPRKARERSCSYLSLAQQHNKKAPCPGSTNTWEGSTVGHEAALPPEQNTRETSEMFDFMWVEGAASHS